MKINRTFAATMREALQLVKQEQGADAVILGNKKVSGGVEILSATDFDEAAVSSLQEAARRRPNRPYTPTATPKQYSSADASKLAGNLFLEPLNGRKEPVLGPVGEQRAPVSVPVPPKTGVAIDRSRPTRSNSARKRVESKQTVQPPKPARRKARSTTPRDGADANVSRSTAHVPVIDEVKHELKNLRDLMESQLSVLQWERFSQKHPVRSVLLNLMSEMGLGCDVCETVLSHLDKINDDPHKVWQQALGIISRCLPISRTDLIADGGRIALVGSTGVGKTTTIAKLAARFAHNHGKRSVAMISTDHFRIGAQEQLQHFARLLEIPLLMAANSEELGDRLSMLEDKKLVLIDTAGMSQRDLRLSEQFHQLQMGSPEIRPYLVLSANTQLAAINQTIMNLSKVRLAGAFVTKIDESASLGGIITASVRHQLPLIYCGTGQKVPEDLEPAKSHRLISRAVALMQSHGEQFGQEALAMRYNHIINSSRA